MNMRIWIGIFRVVRRTVNSSCEIDENERREESEMWGGSERPCASSGWIHLPVAEINDNPCWKWSHDSWELRIKQEFNRADFTLTIRAEPSGETLKRNESERLRLREINTPNRTENRMKIRKSSSVWKLLSHHNKKELCMRRRRRACD